MRFHCPRLTSPLLRASSQDMEPSTGSRAKRKATFARDSAVSIASQGSMDTPARSYSQRNLHSNSRIMDQRAAKQLLQLSTTYRSRKQLQLQENVQLPWYIIHPHDIV